MMKDSGKTTFLEVVEYENGIKYMPFIGGIEGRPSVLKGDMDDIIAQGMVLKEKGVYGIDLLGYR